MSMKDFQRSRVYSWEREHIPSGKLIPFSGVSAYMARIWEAEGLQYPPLLRELPKQTRRWGGLATRTHISLPKDRPSAERIILHELAHSMTFTIDGVSDLHGPNFVGVYMQLASKHLSVPLFLLWHTAKMRGVKFEQFPVIRVNEVA